MIILVILSYMYDELQPHKSQVDSKAFPVYFTVLGFMRIVQFLSPQEKPRTGEVTCCSKMSDHDFCERLVIYLWLSEAN